MEFNFDEDIFDNNCKTSIVKEKQYCPKKCTPEVNLFVFLRYFLLGF